MQNGIRNASFLQSRDDATQEGPLAMVYFGIGVLPLIKRLKAVYPGDTQPWYIDNAG